MRMRGLWQNPLFLFALPWVVFVLLVWEEVTPATLITVVGVLLIRGFDWKTPNWLPKIVGLSLFVLAFLKHGRQVNPEMGLNLLLAVVALKMLEAKVARDWRMLTLGSFLLWATGALFVKTPLYFLSAILGCGLAMTALVRGLGEEMKVSWRELMVWVLRAAPLAVILFFLLPRFSAGIWTPPQAPNQGQVGFSEEARPGDVPELRPSGAISFHATVSPLPLRDRLYWRGMTLSGHDGWNWFASPRDEEWIEFGQGGRLPAPGWWHQDIIHKKAVRRAFALDMPQWWQADGKQAQASQTATFRFPPYRTLRRYSAVSAMVSAPPLVKNAEKDMLISGVKKKLPKEIRDLNPSSLTEAQALLGQFFQKNNFSYSLSPGRVTGIDVFFSVKKGWCAHYASSTALILRSWGFPARLVSGYLGGALNPQGQYFTVSEDDAHVWVEAYDQGGWQRIDPTLWIAPERGQLDGVEFFRRQAPQGLVDQFNLPTWMRDTQRWIDHMNFRFLVWSEEFDQEKQRFWAGKLNWNLSTLYMAGIWVIVGSIIIYWLLEMWRTRGQKLISEERAIVWNSFVEKLRAAGIEASVTDGPWTIRQKTHDQVLIQWLQDWEKTIYQDDSRELEELRKRIKSLRLS